MNKFLRHCLSLLLVFAFLSVSILPTPAQAASIGSLSSQLFAAKDGTALPYRLHIPRADPPEEGYAVYIHLHGAGQVGSDNIVQTQVGSELVKKVLASYDDECIVIVPQCAAGCRWVDWTWGQGDYNSDAIPMSRCLTAVVELLQQIFEEYPVDKTRIYVSGLSMGGLGAWDLIARYPRTFAAAIPVCGGGDPLKADRLTKIAIRTYHSSDDTVVPVSRTRAMVQAIEAAGGRIEYTEYTGLGHGSWSTAFNTPGQADWLLSQARPSNLPYYGDINLDYTVNAVDALLALQQSVEKIALTDEDYIVADVTRDGFINASDALKILQYSVGKITEL